jgi:hypothetical protein
MDFDQLPRHLVDALNRWFIRLQRFDQQEGALVDFMGILRVITRSTSDGMSDAISTDETSSATAGSKEASRLYDLAVFRSRDQVCVWLAPKPVRGWPAPVARWPVALPSKTVLNSLPKVDLNATNSTNSLNSSEFGFARPERLKSLVALPW